MLPSAPVKIVFASQLEKPGAWLPLLERALPHDTLTLTPAADAQVALVAGPAPGTFEQMPRLKLVQSLWMGVEKLLADPSLPRSVPLARLVDPGMVAAMSETVLAHVLDWHRHHYYYRRRQQEHRWARLPQYLPSDRAVGLLGLGALGQDAASKLAALGFNVLGWSRRPKAVSRVECFHGVEGLNRMLQRVDALVCLLPLTDDTRGILDKDLFRKLRQGGCVINVARGAHLVERDLVDALDAGHLAHAYLDVFEPEPLPAEHPLWSHAAVSITPHTAALTEPRTALPVIVENIERVRRGEAPLHLVDYQAGY